MIKTHPTGRPFLRVALICSTASCGASSLAEVSVPSVFSDHMVLQRDLPIPVWGTATPGEAISVTFGNQSRSATTSANGTWRVDLDPMPASKRSRSLEIAGENLISITDVLVGEVWICGGQSNMEWTINGADDPAREKADANRPTLRLIKAPHVTSNVEASDIPANWTVCSPETVGDFTAVGFTFARDLQNALDVPVGLLSINWGGTRIEPWISSKALLAADLSVGPRCEQMKSNIDAHRGMSEGDRFDLSATPTKRTRSIRRRIHRPPTGFGSWRPRRMDASEDGRLRLADR